MARSTDACSPSSPWGPAWAVLMASVLIQTRSYTLALAVFGVALVCASVLVSRLGRYNFPVRRPA